MMNLKDFDGPFKIFLLVRLQLIPAGSDGPGNRCIAQEGDFFFGLGGEIEEFFLENSFDTVSGTINGSDVIEFPCRVNDTSQGTVNHASRAAALGNDDVLFHRIRWGGK
jgi:hypothetical protein